MRGIDIIGRWAAAVRFDWRRWPGKIAGLSLGATGGWFGALIGLLIGHLLDSVAARWRLDGRRGRYLELPGPGDDLEEPAPGAAAFLALAVCIQPNAAETAQAEQLARYAAGAFGLSGAEIPDLESLCRLARQRLDLLNADLLAESLAARRRGYGGLGRLTAALEALAANGAERLRAERIAAALRAAAPVSDGDPIPSEPYAALGLAPGAGLEEVKTAFRKLAVRHHPDTGAGDRERFLRIETAYREILKRLEV